MYLYSDSTFCKLLLQFNLILKRQTAKMWSWSLWAQLSCILKQVWLSLMRCFSAATPPFNPPLTEESRTANFDLPRTPNPGDNDQQPGRHGKLFITLLKRQWLCVLPPHLLANDISLCVASLLASLLTQSAES